MTTITNTGPNPSDHLGMDTGWRMCEWLDLTNVATQGAFVDVSGWLIASVEWKGTFSNAAQFDIQGTNFPESPPGSPSTITVFSATAAGLITTSPLACRAIRPVLTSGGDGSTDVSCRVLLVR